MSRNYGTVARAANNGRRVALGLVIAAALLAAAFVGGAHKAFVANNDQALSYEAGGNDCVDCDACLVTSFHGGHITGKTRCERRNQGRCPTIHVKVNGHKETIMHWCGGAEGEPTAEPTAATATAKPTAAAETAEPTAATETSEPTAAGTEPPAGNVTARAPFGVTVRGGGLRTMTMGMAFARALGPSWPRVTHLGGTSGGTWFASQMVYSRDFYEGCVLDEAPIEDVVVAWGISFGERQMEEIKKGAFWTLGPGWDKTLPRICLPFIKQIDTFFAILAEQGLPITPYWMAYVGAMMLPTIPDIGTAKFNERAAEGLQTATLVAQLSVPPTVFLDSSDREATRHSDYDLAVDDDAARGLEQEALINAAYVVPPSGNGGEWAFNPQLGNMTASVGKKGAPEPVLSTNPFLLEVIAGSSAAGGLVGVQSMADAMIDKQKWLGPGETKTLKRCVPFGLESLAPASLPENITKLSGETHEQAQEVSAAARYRFLDGGFVDDQCAAATLADMQRSCSGACPPAMKLLLISTDNYSTAPLFAGVTDEAIAYRGGPRENVRHDPRRRRGRDADISLMNRGDAAAAAAWIFRGNKSRRRRRCGVDLPW